MGCSLINGVRTEFIDVSDRGLNYGDGLFETILYKDGMCQFWDQHILRMRTGAEKLNITFPGEACFFDDVSKLVEHADSQDSVIKLVLTRGSGQRGYALLEKPKPLRVTSISSYETQDQLNDGIKATICKQTVSINRGLAGIKHLNRLENVIARNEWHDEFHEGIMLDDENNVIEGTMSNLFIIKDGELQTPDLSRSGVAGVIRKNIMGIAKDESLEVNVKQLSLEHLFDADEVFVTNSIIGLWPVIKIDDADFPRGDVSRLLQRKLHQRCRENAKAVK